MPRATRRAARELRAERERQAELAAAAERARIARELHDVVAHSLSVVIAQADGGRYAAEHDPAPRPMRCTRSRATAREAQAEMRRALGVLREQPAPRCSPSPASASSPALVERTREAGLAVQLDRAGRRRARSRRPPA